MRRSDSLWLLGFLVAGLGCCVLTALGYGLVALIDGAIALGGLR